MRHPEVRKPVKTKEGLRIIALLRCVILGCGRRVFARARARARDEKKRMFNVARMVSTLGNSPWYAPFLIKTCRKGHPDAHQRTEDRMEEWVTTLRNIPLP